MTRLHASTELRLTIAGVRASIAAKNLRIASATLTGEANGQVVGGLGYWHTLDTSG